MKIYPEQLTAELAKGLAPAYWVTGDDAFLQKTCCDAIRKAAKNSGYDERIVISANPKIDWQAFAQATQSLSLFSQKQLIELRFNQQKVSKALMQPLIEYFEKPAADICLLIQTAKLEAAQSKTQWVKKLDKDCVSIALWPPNRQQAIQWIQESIRAKGMSVSQQAVVWLFEQTEGNLLASYQEIEKLYLLHGTASIGLDEVAEAVGEQSRFNVYQLVDELLLGNTKKCLKIFNAIELEGLELPIIVWALAREIRMLAHMAWEKEQGAPVASLMQKNGVWAKRKPIVTTALNRLSRHQLEQGLITLARVDRISKGAEQGEPWLEIEQLLLRTA